MTTLEDMVEVEVKFTDSEELVEEILDPDEALDGQFEMYDNLGKYMVDSKARGEGEVECLLCRQPQPWPSYRMHLAKSHGVTKFEAQSFIIQVSGKATFLILCARCADRRRP